MLYGALRYRTVNLGDEIQSLAARNFLPHVDATFDRDAADAAAPAGEHFVICNGWWMHGRGHRYHFPLPPAVRPLFVSVHLTGSFRQQLSEPMVAYLRRHAPVGCRDASTQQFLESIGVAAYWSGCLCMTLGLFGGPRRAAGGYVCLVDVPEWACEAMPLPIRKDAVKLSHHHAGIRPDIDNEEAHKRLLAEARRLVDLYRHARLVVTSRLHCALPCLSYGTPVVVVKSQVDERFDAIGRFARVYRRGEPIDWDAPSADVGPAARPLARLVERAVAIGDNPLRDGARFPEDFAD